jgi:hypothetical protein
VPILGIGNLGFDLASAYKFKVCFGLFPFDGVQETRLSHLTSGSGQWLTPDERAAVVIYRVPLEISSRSMHV